MRRYLASDFGIEYVIDGLSYLKVDKWLFTSLMLPILVLFIVVFILHQISLCMRSTRDGY
jgi:hypothetical protein